MRELSKRVMQHLHKLSLRFHLQRKTGAISRDLERGTRSVATLMNFLVFSTIPIFVEFSLVAFILLSNYAWIFALVTFGTVLFYVIFTLWVTEWRMHYRHTMNKLDSKANTHAFDSLINYETVKYFNNERLEQGRYDEILEEWEDVAVKSQTTMSMLNFGQGAIIAVGVTIIMFLAANGVVKGDMSIGDLVMVNAFMLQLFIPLNALGIIYRQIKYTLADMDLVFKLLKQKPEIQDVADASDINVTKGEIKFEDTVAVVGFSGGGKSTLVRLLFRFYDVNKGRVLIDGQDIKEFTQDSLRESIGIVPQDTKSKRVAIARTILKKPPILIFDEATSSLDSATEQAIQRTLGKISSQTSTLIIAHRLSTIVDADMILVMEAGKIIERGSHQELLAKNGRYSEMWKLQQDANDSE
ncbi:ABC transporter B family member 25 [Nymphon striatum]|nr:ABC transporter B family member 25 [Nymphon striatum]